MKKKQLFSTLCICLFSATSYGDLIAVSNLDEPLNGEFTMVAGGHGMSIWFQNGDMQFEQGVLKLTFRRGSNYDPGGEIWFHTADPTTKEPTNYNGDPAFAWARGSMPDGTGTSSGDEMVATLDLKDVTLFPNKDYAVVFVNEGSGTINIQKTNSDSFTTGNPSIVGTGWAMDTKSYDAYANGINALRQDSIMIGISVPEPTVISLIGLAGGGMLVVHRFRKQERVRKLESS